MSDSSLFAWSQTRLVSFLPICHLTGVPNQENTTRRDVLLAIGTGLVAGGSTLGNEAGNSGIPYRTLGHTGEKVSCIGMGGFHLGKSDLSEGDAIKLIHSGVDRGINFLDNSWDYNKGE